MKNLTRKFKIHKLISILTGKDLELFNFLESICYDLTELEIIDKKHKNKLYFLNNKGELIFQIDDGTLNIRYEYWNILIGKKYNLDIYEILGIMRYMLNRYVYYFNYTNYISFSIQEFIEYEFKKNN